MRCGSVLPPLLLLVIGVASCGTDSPAQVVDGLGTSDALPLLPDGRQHDSLLAPDAPSDGDMNPGSDNTVGDGSAADIHAADGETTAPLPDAVDTQTAPPEVGDLTKDSDSAPELPSLPDLYWEDKTTEETPATCPTPCDDGNKCNGAESCDPAVGCISGTPLTCDDADKCNGAESCDPAVGCIPGAPLACDDGNQCNGTESCNPASGCVAEAPLACDDGNVCNGKETCNPATGCVPETFPACPTAVPECGQSGGAGAAAKNKVVPAEAGGFRLYDEDTWTSTSSIIDGIVAHPSVQQVTLDDVVANLNRVATKVTNVAGTECFHIGFTWNSGDNAVEYWYPQGITGTADAFDGGDYNGHKLGIVSWYHKPEVEGTAFNKGVRLAIYDVTSMSDIDYRLVLLVEPFMNGGTPDFKAVPIHAGGLAWFGGLLYVADTTTGFRVFDMNRILEVQTGNNDWIGKISDASGYHAHNYRYVIPQVGRYKLCSGSCCTRFSFVSLDRSTIPPTLLTGEYSADSISGRLVRWQLDEATGRLATKDGRVQASYAVFPGIDNVQGALSWNGQYYMSCSGNVLGLYTAKEGQTLAKRGWPYGPEDLHYSKSSDNLWSLTEHPGSRYVFAVKLASITAGCN